MAKELMWVCAILPQDLNKELVKICKEENTTVNLPEDVFRFPLHISMKKSFYTTEFDNIKAEIKTHINGRGVICCRADKIVCYNGMVWLIIEPRGDIKVWHDELDGKLLDRFGIPIDNKDKDFKPHISLFTKGKEEQIHEMVNRLGNRIEPVELSLNRFVIGSSKHKDEYFEIWSGGNYYGGKSEYGI